MAMLPQRPAPTAARARWQKVIAWVDWFGAVRVSITAAALCVLVAGAIWFVRIPAPSAAGPEPPVTAGPPSTDEFSLVTVPSLPVVTVPTVLVVHVAGAVAMPGVYRLDPGDRVFAAVEAAGGALPEALLHAVNLAAPLADGQRVHVPVEGEAIAPDPQAFVPDGPSAAVGPISINTASETELLGLPGVGPVIAAAIVEFRRVNGPFSSVDDLVRVGGIGPAKLESMRARVVL